MKTGAKSAACLPVGVKKTIPLRFYDVERRVRQLYTIFSVLSRGLLLYIVFRRFPKITKDITFQQIKF